MPTLVALILMLVFSLNGLGLIAYFIIWKLMIKPTYLRFSGANYYYKKLSAKMKKTKKDIKAEFDTIIEQANRCCAEEKTSVSIMPYYEVDTRDALGFGLVPKLNTILYSSVWIELTLTKSAKWQIAFAQSVGHELGHKDDIPKDVMFLFRKSADRRFFYWVREIRNDLYGVEFARKYYSCTKDEIQEAVRMKANMYDKTTRKKNYHTHPAWCFRRYIIKKYSVLTEEAILCIADKAGCTNKRYIDKLTKAVMEKA